MTFFKQPAQKTTATKTTISPPPPANDDDSGSAGNDRGKPTVDGGDAVDDETNDHVTTSSGHVTSNGDIAESVRQNSKQKLADLAFKPAES